MNAIIQEMWRTVALDMVPPSILERMERKGLNAYEVLVRYMDRAEEYDPTPPVSDAPAHDCQREVDEESGLVGGGKEAWVNELGEHDCHASPEDGCDCSEDAPDIDPSDLVHADAEYIEAHGHSRYI